MSASTKPASQPISHGSPPPVPEDDDDEDEEDDEDDDDDVVVVVVVVVDEVVSPELVVSAPPSPPAPPVPVVVPGLPPTPPLWVDTSPEPAQPVLKTPKIKDRVDPRTSLWRILRFCRSPRHLQARSTSRVSRAR
jgi:hypothetical protein